MASTVELLERLRNAGLTAQQAEAVLAAIEDAGNAKLYREVITETFATKVDLAEVKVDLIKWMVGVGVSVLGIGLAGVYFVVGQIVPKPTLANMIDVNRMIPVGRPEAVLPSVDPRSTSREPPPGLFRNQKETVSEDRSRQELDDLLRRLENAKNRTPKPFPEPR